MLNKFILFLEAVTLIVLLYLGNELLSGKETGNYVTVLSLILPITEYFRRLLPTKEVKETKIMSTGEKVRHAQDLRKQFETEIMKCRAEKLRTDVVIRHVSRKDKYPDIDEQERGISPWFKVGLMETYHLGIHVGLQWTSLTECPEGYRHTDCKENENGEVKVLLMGAIPFDVIETVNMTGDEYYSFPHIFCHFPYNSEPYERLFYCEKIMQSHGHPWFKEVSDYETVKQNSKKHKIEEFA